MIYESQFLFGIFTSRVLLLSNFGATLRRPQLFSYKRFRVEPFSEVSGCA